MANNYAFKSQIASIMEVLANTAVAEICKLIDNDYAVLRLEISQNQNENRMLKRKVQMMELKMARDRAERTIRDCLPNARSRGRTSVMDRNKGWRGGGHFVSRDRLLANQGESSWRGRRWLTDTPSKRTVGVQEPTVTELEGPVILIKEEVPEAVMPETAGTSWKRVVGPACDGMVLPTVTAEPLGSAAAAATGQHGSGHNVVEVSGSDAVLMPEIKTEEKTQSFNQRPEHTRATTDNGSKHSSPDCLVVENLQALVAPKECGPGSSFTGIQSSTRVKQSVPCADGAPDLERPLDVREDNLEVAIVESSVKVENYEHVQCVDNTISSMVAEYDRFDASSSSFGLGNYIQVSNMGLSDARNKQVRYNQTFSGPEVVSVSDQALVAVATASKDKRFTCSFCSKRFSCPKKVEIHMRVHTGEKPFSCSQCRMCFAQAGNLKRHQRVHTGEKPFSCSLCEKRFSHLHQLKMHLKVHSGERPFGCPHCTRRFSEKSYLRIHMHKSHSAVEHE